MRWPWSRTGDQPTDAVDIDPNAPFWAQFIRPSTGISGVTVDETSAMGLSGFYRAVSLISGTLASLPMPSYRDDAGKREKVSSIFDDPDGPDGQTPFEWKETAFAHLILHGKCGALKIRNDAGGLVRLPLVHPGIFTEELPTGEELTDPKKMPVGGLFFRVQLADGKSVRLDGRDFWYVPGLSLDGKTGVSLLTYARLSLATAIAGDTSAGNMFAQGALISGMATPEDDNLDTDDLPEVRRQLDSSMLGQENAGRIAVINRKLKFTPWTMSAVDSQFLQSRQFSIEEISRWTGVPPHLLMQVEKQTSWGTGVDSQNQGMSKFVLGHWANRFEQRASRLLARPRWCEFDFAGLERPNFAVEIELLLKQTGGKPILTVNEARAIRNLPPVAGGNELMPAPQPAPEAPTTEGSPDAPAE